VSVDVPLIDLAAPDGPERVAAACTRTGFFVLSEHGLDAELAAAFDAARRFFALPVAVKDRSAMVGNDGYAGIGSRRAGGKEMLDISLDGFHRWPALDGFRDAVERYQSAALGVAADVLRTVAVSLGIDPDFFAARMHHPQCFLRMLRYPPGDGEVSTGQHTDYGAITLLATDGVPGLEVRRRDGTWTAVDAPSGALVVNLGDMLARWTNDRYVSTPHRVVSTGDERCSMPFFVNPDPEVEVTCIPTCVTPERPCRYAPITAAEFLQARIDGRITLDDEVRRPAAYQR
jgi:isopenicillin N synthase-like dioxygenase